MSRMRTVMRALLVVPLLIGGTVFLAGPAAAAPGCVSENVTLRHFMDPHRHLVVVQTTCIENTSAGAGYHATVSVRPAGEPASSVVKAYLRVELHDCTTGTGLSANGYDTFLGAPGVEANTNWVRKTSYPRVYAQARVESIGVTTDQQDSWRGVGVFQSSAGLTC